MTNPEQSLQTTLASEEYWANPVENPYGNYELAAKLQNTSAKFDRDKAQEIGGLVLALNHDDPSFELEEGEQIPIPSENSRDLIKVVRDTRVIVPRPIPSLLYKTEYPEKRTDFHEAGQMVLSQHHYTGPTVSMILQSGILSYTYIERDALYLRQAQEDGELVAIRGEQVGSHSPEDMKDNTIIPFPVVNVGTTYKEDSIFYRKTSKVVAATVLEARGVAWTHRNKKGDKQPRRWKPGIKLSFTPGMAGA